MTTIRSTRLLAVLATLAVTGPRLSADPDLVITELADNSGRVLRAGQTYTVRLRVKNVGTSPAPSSVVAIVLRGIDQDVGAADTHLGHASTGALDVGRDVPISLTVRIPYHWNAFPTWIGAVADVAGAVVESDERNNGRSLQSASVAYAGAELLLEWVRARYPDDRRSRTFAAVGGVRSQQIAIVAPSEPSQNYVLYWSGSPVPFRFDVLTDFSLSGAPWFVRWAGTLGAGGRGHAVLSLPDVPGLRLDAWVHGVILRPGLPATTAIASPIR